MGVVYQHIRLSNFSRDDLEVIDANALVDSGAIELCIPAHVAKQLQLKVIEQRKVSIADGRQVVVDLVGPVRTEVFGRRTVCGALVMGNQVLLGAIPMESMDLLIHPAGLQLVPNPANPTTPGSLAMGVRFAAKDDNA